MKDLIQTYLKNKKDSAASSASLVLNWLGHFPNT